GLGEGGAFSEERGETQSYLPSLLERGESRQQGELLRPGKEIAMRPCHLGAEAFRRTIADAKLQAMRFALDHLELDIQRLVSRLGIERSRGHGLKHPQAVNGVSTGREILIGGALPLVNR